ncbi:hypothetical protein QVD17_05070 [Tagetes erecta]|uniref:Uncharacterized protein n=1 Tax=Tagetes erecta TaxID=13708 RepID=A0AAD8LEC3_TARER|nr:hypothetical protein QVD17_05070 [Tagetes erecta]
MGAGINLSSFTRASCLGRPNIVHYNMSKNSVAYRFPGDHVNLSSVIWPRLATQHKPHYLQAAGPPAEEDWMDIWLRHREEDMEMKIEIGNFIIDFIFGKGYLRFFRLNWPWYLEWDAKQSIPIGVAARIHRLMLPREYEALAIGFLGSAWVFALMISLLIGLRGQSAITVAVASAFMCGLAFQVQSWKAKRNPGVVITTAQNQKKKRQRTTVSVPLKTVCFHFKNVEMARLCVAQRTNRGLALACTTQQLIAYMGVLVSDRFWEC